MPLENETQETQTTQPDPEDTGAQDPQEGQTAAQSTEQEGQATSTSQEDAQTPEKTPQEKMVSEKRFKEVYWQWKQAEREKEELEARVKSPNAQQQTQPQKSSDGKPDISNYDDYATYNEALLDWRFEQERKNQAEQQAKNSRQQRFNTFDQKIGEQVAKDPEFEQKAFIPTPMLDHFVDSEDPVALALYFGQHKDEAVRLQNLPQLAIAREIGKIEARIASEKAGPAQRYQTNAPDPTAPVGDKTKTELNTDKMTTAEWIKHRDALQARGEL